MSKSKEKLEKYKRKRDFHKTPEPEAGGEEISWADDRPVFVIQKHDASKLHFDLRLEVDGVLKSWAVPKGPSTDPTVKRLAIPTEDHPLAYADFEGVIPEGEYGGGTMIIWDRGNYRNLKIEESGEEKAKSLARQIDDGHVTIRLEGQKLCGGYALIRTGSNDDSRWLLVKINDNHADPQKDPVRDKPESVKSGRTLDEIRNE